MNKVLKYTIMMVCIGGLVSLLLSVVNVITKPIIEEQKIKKVSEVLNEVDEISNWKNGESLVNLDSDNILNVFVTYENDEIKYIAYLINTYGYSNGLIETVVFINNKNSKIHLIRIVNIEGQTKGIGTQIIDDESYVKYFENIDTKKYYNDSVKNHNSNSSDIISGATISSKAVVEAIIIACNNYESEVK